MVHYTLEKSDDVKKCFANLYDIVNYLRDPKDGCPWDKEQTTSDIIRSLQGELYEYVDALLDKDTGHQSEEIGDVFLNIFLLLKIHDQTGDFKASDAINDACEKYIRRHPHVFANVKAETSEEVLKNWAQIKKTVEGRTDSNEDFFSNVEKSAPELERCYKISKKAAKVGFEWANIEGVYDKVNEELEEVKEANTEEERLEELGDVLFSVVNLCRWYKIKPQDALAYANLKFTKRFNKVIGEVKKEGKEAENLTPAEWDEFWNIVKNNKV